MSRLVMHLARPADRDRLTDLQARAMRVLGAPFYTRRQIDSFIGHVGLMDDYLLADGTYYLAEIDGLLAGCGGWTLRRPGYDRQGAGDSARPAAPAQPTAPRATVRSVFVDPVLARMGVGRQVMQRVETAIREAGHDSAGLMATLSGASFYRAIGYRDLAARTIVLPDGERFDAVSMEKRLSLADAA